MKWSISFAVLCGSVCCAQQQQEWSVVDVPQAFRSVPSGDLTPIDGYSVYRCLVEIPVEWNSDVVTLHVEALDDARAVYVNGIKVGATGTFPPRYRSGLGERGEYSVPMNRLKPGERNTVSIQVYQDDPRPNFSVAPPVLINEAKQQGIRLNGLWQYRPGRVHEGVDGVPATVSIEGQEIADGKKIATVFSSVDEVHDIQQYVTLREGDRAALSPEKAVSMFDVPDDLEISLVLSEPDIAQPLFMTWDSAGRLWVMEYRQYPEVAGVEMLSRDVYLRSVYDKMPEPPPNGVKGKDRISIHEDTDGDGVYDSHKTFVDGLNIASSFAIGRGGVFVTNPPYLLFYPDEDGDDVPDRAPEVLLKGFGLEDSHSVINSLRFGPDGWLYGCQGSTVTARVRRPGSSEPSIQTMGQQIWRYHPETREFEVFAEGGGNTFGCEIDSRGNVFSGHNGGNTRGFHYVQGGYYKKGFGKHGPLSNPYAFGYFPSMKHAQVPRFTHNFIVYEDSALPEQYHGQLFGIEPLQGQVVLADIRPFQSSFETQDISRVVKSTDQWFRPVDIKVGPDEAVYIADMYEQRIDHSSHYAGRIDRDSGRIYKIHGKPASREAGGQLADYAAFSTARLIQTLGVEGRTDRQTILRILGDRKDKTSESMLLQQLNESTGQTALESLWALHACDRLTPQLGVELLDHKNPDVRAWTVRLLCDRDSVSPAFADRLVDAAAEETNIHVRKQMASSAKRISSDVALPLIRNLLSHNEDAQDIHQPLLLWWALESKVDSGVDEILGRVFVNQEVWTSALVQHHILNRLIKRFALAGTRRDLVAVARLLAASPNQLSTEKLLAGFEEAYQGRSFADLPDELVTAIEESGGGSLALRLRQGQSEAVRQALELVEDATLPVVQRVQLVQVLGQINQTELVEPLLRMADGRHSPQIQLAALGSLQSSLDARIADVVIGRLPIYSEDVRNAAEELLASRAEWSLALLESIDQGGIQPSDIHDSTVRKMLLHQDKSVRDYVQKLWGQVTGASSDEMIRRTAEVRSILRSGSGNPKKGKPLFMKHCGQCHLLFGEGGDMGPDLTSFTRDNVDRMLANIVNPNLEIREGFENHVVVTTDGRVVSGLLADKDHQVMVLRGVDGQNVIVPQGSIDETFTSKASVMPEGTLKGLNHQEIRDLFAYFRSSQPVNY